MKPLKLFNFRDFYKNLIYIEDKETLEILTRGYGVKARGDETGLLCYGYMDHDKGMSFNVLSLVNYQGTEIDEDGNEKSKMAFNDGPLEKNINHTLRLDDLFNLNGDIPKLDPDDMARYVNRAVKVNELNMVTEDLEAVRYQIQLDSFRHFIYGDDLEAYVFDASNKKLEGIWVRSMALTDRGVVGKLITEVSDDFGLKLNDEIALQLYQVDGSIRLMKIIGEN